MHFVVFFMLCDLGRSFLVELNLNFALEWIMCLQTLIQNQNRILHEISVLCFGLGCVLVKF